MAIVHLSDTDMNGRKIINLGTGTANSTDAASTADVQAAREFARSLANATGTMLHTFISDFDTAVRFSTLNQMSAPTGPLALNGQRVTGGADGIAGTDLVTLQQMTAALAVATTGLVFKGAARVAAAGNVSTAAPGATVDGVAPTAGDVVLLTGQTTGSQNGAWVWNGAAAAMTRPANWDTSGEAVPGSLWVVQQGTYDNQLAIMANNTFVLGTDTATFVFINPAAASDNDTGYSENCPTTAAGAAWPVNHNLGTKDVGVSVRRVASPYDEVQVVPTFDTVNQVNIRPDIALVAGDFRVIVWKVV